MLLLGAGFAVGFLLSTPSCNGFAIQSRKRPVNSVRVPATGGHFALRSSRASTITRAFDPAAVFYNVQLQNGMMVEELPTGFSPVYFVVLFGGGLLSCLSPCGLSMIPATLAYLSAEMKSSNGKTGNRGLLSLSLWYAFGLSFTLASIGLFASALGETWGSGNPQVVDVGVSLLLISSGLILLELIDFKIPSLMSLPKSQSAPEDSSDSERALRAFAFGASSALASSPCSTPVLASLLGVAAATSNKFIGLLLFGAYAAGYSTPIVVAANLGTKATLKFSEGNSQISEFSSLILASLLIAYGIYSGLGAVFPLE
mmetsp:Transcript_34606/g.78226  ORF Transcript_34606/g.78226 Transcript_34606/m.78226 type:complete len:314 (+) Transcript_34606:114-1055(+)